MSQITNFPITVYGIKEKFNDTITRGRCRVFHTGHNRNGTYITDDFAKKLIASAPYTPVKGIYNVDDYTDHGGKRSEGKIYGIIPADPNFAWEKHEDEDGVVRTYACFDVLYYTALYEEATEIVGKGESMELYRQTLKGAWKFIEGRKAYVFTDGCFLGLQVLGDETEPCFQGASFYSKEEGILALLEKYEKRPELFQSLEQGGNIMNINFKLSDSQKHDLLFRLLNPQFNEEGGWLVDCVVCEVYEEYAVVVNYADASYERVYYTRNDAQDEIEITQRERCYIVDVNAEEKEALRTLKGEGTYAQVLAQQETNAATISDQATTIESLTDQLDEIKTQKENYSTKVAELENTISTLTIERDGAQNYSNSLTNQLQEVNNRNEELTADYETLRAERDSLAQFQKEVVDTQKKNTIQAYADILPQEVIDTYMTNMDNYDVKELDMHLTYECKKVNPTIFSKNPTEPQPQYIPKEDDGGRGIQDILARYERK